MGNTLHYLGGNPLFIICFSVGLIFIATGFFMFRFPPKNINSLYGYRTKSSMKNLERWNFAQKFSAKEMMKLGAFLILASLIPLLLEFTEALNLIIALSLTLLGLTVFFIKVENAIKEKFGD